MRFHTLRRAMPWLLLAVIAASLPVFLTGHALMSRVAHPEQAVDSLPMDEVRMQTVSAVADYLARQPGVLELRGTPLHLDRSDIEAIAQRVLSVELVRQLFGKLYGALGRYLRAPPDGSRRMTISIALEKRILIQALFQHWSRRLDALPGCGGPEPSGAAVASFRSARGRSLREAGIGGLLMCQPSPALKSEILTRIDERLREYGALSSDQLVVVESPGRREGADLGPWIGRLRALAELFLGGRWGWLLLFAVAVVGLLVLAGVERRPPWTLLRRVGVTLLIATGLVLASAAVLYGLSLDTEYYRWLLDRPSTQLTEQQRLGAQLAVYAVNRLFAQAAQALVFFAVILSLAGGSALGARRVLFHGRERGRGFLPTRV